MTADELKEESSSQLLRGHFWLPFGQKGNRCAFCAVTASSDKQKRLRSQDLCRRDLAQLGNVIDKEEDNEHQLHWVVHNKTALRVPACSRCDAYATVSPKLLLEPCKPKQRRPNGERLAKGKFPTNKFGNVVRFCLPFRA